MKKRYTISYDWSFDLVVDIDHDVMTDANLHEINNFWNNADYRLRKADGDISKAVLTMLGLTAFTMSVEYWDADDRLRRGDVEGWPQMDGKYGITLVSLDTFELDEDDLSIKEATL